jgi:AbiV family abortive infection protein
MVLILNVNSNRNMSFRHDSALKVSATKMKKELAVDGIVKCINNAERLIDAAQFLFSGNYGVGTALLVTAIEEYGKALLIIAKSKGIILETRFQKAFRRHDFKRAYGSLVSIVSTLVADGVKDAFNFTRVIDRLNFPALRDGALYVDYKAGKFVAPKSPDRANFAKVLRLALRLRRTFAIMTDKKACLEVITDTWSHHTVNDTKHKLLGTILKGISGRHR